MCPNPGERWSAGYGNAAYFDVDDTLILHQPVAHNCSECIGIHDAKVHIHDTHVQQLKAHKAAGDTVVVWSARGVAWASSVVAALNLEAHVDVTLSKPTWHYDDIDSDKFMGRRIYLEPRRR